MTPRWEEFRTGKGGVDQLKKKRGLRRLKATDGEAGGRSRKIMTRKTVGLGSDRGRKRGEHTVTGNGNIHRNAERGAGMSGRGW